MTEGTPRKQRLGNRGGKSLAKRLEGEPVWITALRKGSPWWRWGMSRLFVRVGTKFFRIESGLVPWVKGGDGGAASSVHLDRTSEVIKQLVKDWEACYVVYRVRTYLS